MKTMLYNFVKDEHGQDLIEYTLLLAFVCLASAAPVIGRERRRSINNIVQGSMFQVQRLNSFRTP